MREPMSSAPSVPNGRTADTSIAVWAALLAALVASLGSLWLTMGMELEACPLCFYQRTCVMAVVGILGIGLLLRDQNAAGVGAMALPVAATGLGVGIIHSVLEYTGKLECPKGIMDIGTAPQQAIVAQAILVAFLLIAARTRVLAAFIALLMGGAVAWLLFATSPKPVIPNKAYDGKMIKCRVPYVSPDSQPPAK